MFRRIHPVCAFFDAKAWASRTSTDNISYPPADAFMLARHGQSAELMKALRAIEQSTGPFDVIEFPDFGGIAFATLQEKLMGRAFARSTIAVRIHSTEAVLRSRDHRPAHCGNLVIADIERKALSDADVVVGHLHPIIDDVASHFGFSETWQRKAVVETPPVLLESDEREESAKFTETTPLVFTSKIQWVKRAHVFINAAVGFMDSTPEYQGDALLLAHIVNDELYRHCESLIPDHLKARIKILDNLHNTLREETISNSVAIFPAAYESFCLAAYEANLLGALVILNRNNPAFGHKTPWANGTSCEKFDGTAHDLVGLLQDMWSRRHGLKHERVALKPASAPYWMHTATSKPSLASEAELKRLSIIVATSDEYGDPMDTIYSALQVEGLNVEVIFACDRLPSATERAAVFERLKASSLVSNGTVKIVELGFRGGLAALCNLGIRSTENDFVAICRAGTSIGAAFLIDAVEALNAQPDFDFVIPQLIFEKLPSEPAALYPDRVRLGEALNTGVVANLFGTIEMVGRRPAIEAIGFDESLDRNVDWDFHMRACASGHRYIVSNRVEARVELFPDATPISFRSHIDAVLVKHEANSPGGKVTLAAALDATDLSYKTWKGVGENEGEEPDISTANSVLISRRPISYYFHERRPWWKIALKNPNKPVRWLLLREMQARVRNRPQRGN
ncbi:hypothetical protein [Hyphomicrobium sp.]|uniref:hypothetical protein n=1 Tax=Hyphomicrobium sp. TaxID=82 RepID=UPI0025BC0BFB|nr:hypothetical protein [Hyphomicrobium sp.]